MPKKLKKPNSKYNKSAQYLVYGDLINSRKMKPKDIMFFWKELDKLNYKLSFNVPFRPLLGDSFHGITKNKEEALLWVEEIRKFLNKKKLKARYVIIPVIGNFSSINTIKKYSSIVKRTVVNPMNIPELIIADNKIKEIKDSKKDELKILRTPSLKYRQKHHTLCTIEYYNKNSDK